jgi:hypothetical protein
MGGGNLMQANFDNALNQTLSLDNNANYYRLIYVLLFENHGSNEKLC